MCAGVEVRDGGKARKIYFVGESAALPVLFEDSTEIEWVRWGRRKNEKCSFPQGGWARLSAIQAGDWHVYNPRRAVAVVERFLQGERSSALRGRRLSQWVLPPKGQSIECLVIGDGEDRRAYVVTTSPPAKLKALADRWPLLVTRSAPALLPPPTEMSVVAACSDDARVEMREL